MQKFPGPAGVSIELNQVIHCINRNLPNLRFPTAFFPIHLQYWHFYFPFFLMIHLVIISFHRIRHEPVIFPHADLSWIADSR